MPDAHALAIVSIVLVVLGLSTAGIALLSRIARRKREQEGRDKLWKTARMSDPHID